MQPAEQHQQLHTKHPDRDQKSCQPHKHLLGTTLTAVPRDYGLRWLPNHLQCYALVVVFREGQGLCLALEALQEFRVLVRAGFDVCPGQDLVLARRDSAEVEPAVLIRVSLPVKRVAPRAGDQHNDGARYRLAVFVMDRAIHPRAGQAYGDLKGAMHTAGEVDLTFGDLLIAVVDRLDVGILRLAIYIHIVSIWGDTLQRELAIIADRGAGWAETLEIER